MSRDPRYDVLFEPVRIGPVVAKNRFYQVPHCTGMGAGWPNASVRFREIKAEGGWAVVCTEECMIHPSSDHAPSPYVHLWEDADIAPMARTVEAIHAHDALAGAELSHAGKSTANRMSREVPLAPSAMPYMRADPISARAMTKADIRELRRWHRAAAIRAKQAGFDIVYVYCAHDLATVMQFLLPRYNHRTDEYGGSLENRARLLRELIEDTKEAVGDTCAVALRFAVDELRGDDGLTWDGEGKEVVEMLAELPDLWDVNISDWPNDSGTSRFFEEGYQAPYTAFVKALTSKPVVGVGRFTSPDAMVAQIRRGHLDLIGAARPSIADPFLPKKIEEGRPEDIRECIGCNICATGQMTAVPMRCTQNPTVGEEWRRGWHPEAIAAAGSDDQLLVVGGGPAGLECAMSLGRRGYHVTLAEAGRELGGRLIGERRLPGLAQWGRVVDHRVQQIQKLANVEVFLASELTAAQVLEFAVPRVVVATGSSWRRDGVGRENHRPVEGCEAAHVYAPEQVVAGDEISGPVVVFDDDHYYLGSVIAEKLAGDGADVTLVTSAAELAGWTRHTLEWTKIQTRLAELGIDVVVNQNLAAVGARAVTLANVFTGERRERACRSVVMVTSRRPRSELFEALDADAAGVEQAGIKSVTPIGDCVAPSSIAIAVYAGHRYARELDEAPNMEMAFELERVELAV